MQLNCKLLSCYCKQVWYFIGGCSAIQCENNNGDMSSRSKTWLIIGSVLAGILFLAIIVIIVIIVICCKKETRRMDGNLRVGADQQEREMMMQQN